MAARPTTNKSTTTTVAPKESTVTTKTQPAPKDYKAVAAKEPSDLHRNFAAWLQEQTGVEVDLKTVQLVASLRHDFQRSDANQKDLQARRNQATTKAAKAEAAKKAKVLADAIAMGLIEAPAKADA